MTTNRWLIAVAAVVMQICLGAAYGWSVFVGPLVSMTGWTLTQVSLNFTLAIAFLGVGTIIGGLWQDRVGPRPVATVAGIVYGISYLLAGYFASAHSLGGLYFSYGLLGGIGMGMGYITPVATITKWFPDRRGLMTGVAVAGYGAGALIMSPFAARSIVARGVPATFAILGACIWCWSSPRRSSTAIRRQDGGRPTGSLPARSRRRRRRPTSPCRRRCARRSSGCSG